MPGSCSRLAVAAAMVTVPACMPPLPTLAQMTLQSQPPRIVPQLVDIPADLEIRNVSFSASTDIDVTGSSESTTSVSHYYGYVNVYAVHRRTGVQYLLVYESDGGRLRPVQVVRLRISDVPLPDSLR